MGCTTHFAGIEITRSSNEECEWIDNLNIILNGGNGECKKALQGLAIIRNYRRIMFSYVGMELYRTADQTLKSIIINGRCKDFGRD